MKTKEILRKWADPLMALSAMLYLIALCIGITGGIIPYVLLLTATFAMTIIIVEAVVNRRTFVTFVYRLVAFFICWAGVFANQKEPVLESACALIAMFGVFILIVCFVYYMNTKNIRDAEKFFN
jgi:hypothetical protein